MTPQAFIDKWKDNKLSERAGAQSHFLDLCELLAVDRPADPANYCFERGAKRTGADRGWADVWKRHAFAWEYKAPGAKLDAALKQLMTYALALDNPPLLVVSDRLRIEIHTHFTGAPSEMHTIALADIGSVENLKKLRWLFTDPNQFKPERTRTAITLQAAKLIGDLAWQLQQRKHDPHRVAHFLNKVIFCLFAEDARGPASEPLLPSQLFTTILNNGRKDVARFEKQLKNLFRAMSERHGEFGEHFIQWFNGGLFDDDITIPLNADDIDKLINVSLLDWSAIEPSIFGTLFERGLDPAKRSQLGAHYTDPVSIMRIVNPVIVEPLLAEWETEKAAIAAQMLVFQRFATGTSSEKKKAAAALKDATRTYITFKERLKNFKVLDPACGSGNFLYLALQALKDIELRVGLEAEELGLERGFPEVGPQSMHGIEISPYAAELAKVTVWIGDIQWMLKHGFAPSREPILKTLDQIQCRDALLTPSLPALPREGGESQSGEGLDSAANARSETKTSQARIVPTNTTKTNTSPATSPSPLAGEGLGRGGSVLKSPATLPSQWPTVHAIIGNPPFLGGSKMREELGDDYTATLRAAYAGKVPGGADLVCYWFAKAHDAVQANANTRAGLVATNSIRQSTNRPVLERIVSDGEIFNAWSDEAWVNEGAAVRVSIVCFGESRMETATADSSLTAARNDKFLDGRVVARINADLTGDVSAANSLDVTKAKGLRENAGVSFQGIPKAGPFDIEGSLAREWLKLPNPHGKSNSEVLKPSWNGIDVTRRQRDGWIIDFGPSMEARAAALYELPFQHVVKYVKPEREKNSEKSSRDLWWRHQRSRPEMRAATKNLRRFIVTPEVAKHRPFVWLDHAVLPDKMLIVIARDDNTTFGILSSRLHVAWALALGGSLEDRPRYNPTLCFQTFPFPEGLTPDLKPADYTNRHATDIAAAAKRLNELRTNWLNPPDWVDVVPEVVAGYPDRIIAKPEYAKAIKERTLTNLYNKRQAGEVQWLEDAHQTLDAAVAAAYGWADYSVAMADEEILRRLLALNLARSA